MSEPKQISFVREPLPYRMESPNYWVALLVGLCIFLLANWGITTRIQYTESVVIERAVHEVYDAIRYQTIQWIASAPPKARSMTGSDGQIGATLLSYGRPFQRISRLVENSVIDFELSAPFGQHPFMHYELQATTKESTTLILHFENRIDRPFHIVVVSAGIPEYFRSLHKKDLLALKTFLEDESQQAKKLK